MRVKVTQTGGTPALVQLVAQTGMPTIYQKRSRELIYDALQAEPNFKKNPYGPQLLILARPQYHW